MSGLEGSLFKWINMVKGWQTRWFVLEPEISLLSYYTSREKMMKGVRRGCVRLRGAIIGIDDQDVNTFTITVDHKTFHFQARDGEEREKWVRHLEDAIARSTYRYRSDQAQIMSGSASSSRNSHLVMFDKKVSEADTYLQMVIDQSAKIEQRINEIEDEEERGKYESLKQQINDMLDHIKHSIVLLQIAKNTANPINGIYNGPMKTDPDDTATPGNRCDLLLPPELAVQVPETSYSSSEGEEDFYDANDDPFSSQVTTPSSNNRTIVEPASRLSDDPFVTANDNTSTNTSTPTSLKKQDSIESPLKDVGHRKRNSKSLPLRNDGSLDYDAIYEDESDNDLSMESHGSVITHLLSQVKIGMDLTKVVLPTFILERRSLLEMYADYFAHPDLFIKIAEFKDPRDRMMQVVRWYLSAYHAGRKSAVAKKPYNPIIGEIFRCHWNIPEYEIQDNTKVIEEGPVPWCKSDQLTFIAEQVSHHPPISAFYAEHYSKKISFSAHVWTKSKFLGLSIGVHNIGQGIVTLCDLNEEYILTFPNGYGRSILSVPWIELGGNVTIKCPKTGYHAEIDFLTKPFYGGKRNRIQGEVYAPNEKKSFLSIYGEWSGLMEAKWNDGTKTKPEVFVDVNRIPIYKKQVRSVIEQDENESRRIWKEVTAGLKSNDIDVATAAKFRVEQKQREEAKSRKDENTMWANTHFKSAGEGWIYLNPLSHRLTLEQR
ncbi:oxysterol-binding protein-related protein 9 isoform X2 [Chironomus tepperi]|uniref:oxysterol-binding protein-related protein 9 isoform X2 n=1 Tax=Chironomus tepperi TaxID=113505 RepID=UPI00391FA07D